MKTQLSQVTNNPYRDLSAYPIMAEIINILRPSIQKTGFWGGLRARPAGNQITLDSGEVLTEEADINEYLTEIDAAFDDDGNPLFEVEQAFGHHRVAAALAEDVDEADFSITYIADDIMLQMMAEENHRDATNNIAVMLETYKQTKMELEAQAGEFETFNEYEEKYTFFGNQKVWKNARSQGVGFQTIRKFLGESWPEAAVRAGVATLADISDGIFEQEQVIRMSSMSIVGEFGKLCKAIRDMDVPDFFKDRYIKQVSEYICNPKEGSTVKIIRAATKKAKDGCNPFKYIKTQTGIEFNLVNELKTLSGEDEFAKMPVDALLGVDGLKDYEGIEDAIEKVKEVLQKAADKASGGDELDADGTASTSDAQAEADAAIADAEAEAGDMAEGAVSLPPLEDNVTDGAVSLSVLAATFGQSAGVFASQTQSLIGAVDKMEAEELDRFGTAFENVFQSLVLVGIEAYGKDDLMTMIEKAQAVVEV